MPQANPVILNARGIPASPIWIGAGQSLKFVITDSNDVVLQTIDGISGVNDPAATLVQDQWLLYSAAPTYISATSFSVAGDQTGTFQVNRRVKTLNTGGTAYSTIRTSSFAAGITTVTVVNDSLVLDSGLSSVSYGLLSATSPALPTILSAVVTFSSTGVTVPDSVTRYLGANGVTTAAETDSTWRVPCAGTFLMMYAQTPGTTTGTRIYTMRKNGADQALTCTSTGATGTASDLTHSFTVVAGDSVTCKLVTSGGSNVVAHNVSTLFVPSGVY